MDLFLDLEVYSSTDLTKAGVFRYVESEDFEILLLGYSVDGGEVKVVDIASGERIPSEIEQAILDPKVRKFAFNAQFERICLSRYFGKSYLDPDPWYCTMVWAATLGLPLSLEGVGEVLGIEKKKLTTGKELIRYFCKPVRPKYSNNFRTRNRWYDDKEKWEMFKAYNKRDVEAEMDIHKVLMRFPVPQSEWDNYHLDQRINDMGIALDMRFVEKAIECDSLLSRKAEDKARELTGLTNPNSTVQLKEWFKSQGQEVPSLAKGEVERLIKESSGAVQEALLLRQELSKSSVKKYLAMSNAVCADGRARGLIQFYGASRTGRWCLTGDHEVLTKDGWVRLDEWKGGEIACWTPSGERISFQKSECVSFDYEGDMYTYEDKRISQVSTPDHRMPHLLNGKWEVATIEQLSKSTPVIYVVGWREPYRKLECKPTIAPFKGKVYCASTPSGFFLVRRNYKVWVTGNSGRLIQVQNLPANHLPDLKGARECVLRGETVTPNVLSELIRTAFIPKPNHRFIVCDFSAIEARVVSYLAGEKWKIQAFAEGKDLYCTTASQMFGVPVEKHGVNAHLRQKGKITELACIAEGSLVLTHKGLVPIENVTLEHLLWDGQSWVKHDGVIYKGIREVMTYEGLTATPDHYVWVEGKQKPVQFREVAPHVSVSGKAKVYDILNAGENNRFTVSGKLVHNCGYGGSVGALKAMGAMEMGLAEDELKALVTAWRNANASIVKLWWEVDEAVKRAVRDRTQTYVRGVYFTYSHGLLFITLPSGRRLAYIRPRLGVNKYGIECVTYEGVGTTKKWERLESYGPKFVENIVQAVSRDILAEAMQRLSNRGFSIVMHVHDEVVLEAPKGEASVEDIAEIMSESPKWASGLLLRADGYECDFYKKE